MNSPKDFHIGIKAVIQNNGKVLILKRLSKDGMETYGFPGGRIDQGEGIEQALARELKEELDLTDFKIGDLLYISERENYGMENRSLMLVFYQVAAQINKITLSSEHVDYLWIDKEKLQDLKQHMHEGTKVVLEKVLK